MLKKTFALIIITLFCVTSVYAPDEEPILIAEPQDISNTEAVYSLLEGEKSFVYYKGIKISGEGGQIDTKNAKCKAGADKHNSTNIVANATAIAPYAPANTALINLRIPSSSILSNIASLVLPKNNATSITIKPRIKTQKAVCSQLLGIT